MAGGLGSFSISFWAPKKDCSVADRKPPVFCLLSGGSALRPEITFSGPRLCAISFRCFPAAENSENSYGTSAARVRRRGLGCHVGRGGRVRPMQGRAHY